MGGNIRGPGRPEREPWWMAPGRRGWLWPLYWWEWLGIGLVVGVLWGLSRV